MSIADKLTLIAENEPKVYEAGIAQGKQDHYDWFWDKYQLNGNKRYYEYAFAGRGWTEETYNPKYPIIATGASNGMFANNYQITNTKVPIEVDAQAVQVFTYANKLKTIVSLKVTENVTYTNWFTSCSALEEINFTEDSVIANDINFSPCTELTVKTINGVISVLKDFSGTGTTKKLTLGTTNLAKLTEAEKAVAIAKGWTLA